MRESAPRSFAAIEVMRRFLTGDASKAERSAACSAACSMAYSVAHSMFNDKLTQMLLSAKASKQGDFPTKKESMK